MRKARGKFVAAVVLAAALAACQQQPTTTATTEGPPTDAQREAGIAAQQLAALGGPANAATRELYTGEFQASGAIGDLGQNEGVWELRLLDDYAQLERPGLGQDGGIPGEREYHEHGMRVVAGDITVTLMSQQCSLPNGVTTPYVAQVLFEGVAYQGCARRGGAQGARATWASVLPELIPAIDACLSRVTSRPARITIASALDDAQVMVRIREADGTRNECIAEYSGASVSVYEPVSDLDRRSGEGDPEFQRGGGAPRAQRCQAVTEAKTASGARVGWLIGDNC